MGQSHGVECRGEGGGEIVSDSSPFSLLPEHCISDIISFTSPLEACVVASVSRTFESAAKSDTVWDKFLPPDYESLVPRSRDFSSKKEFYFALCENPILIDDPVLIDNGKMSLWLERASGKRCIMLLAMNLSVTWGNSPEHWQWISVPEARFGIVPELIKVCWFHIDGKMNTRVLSPGTRYSAYIVFKKEDDCYGFEDVAIEAAVGVVGQEPTRRSICFDEALDGKSFRRERGRSNLVKPEERKDGWMEIELGEFFNEGDMFTDEIEIKVSEIKELNWKRGLIILGIEIRPTKIL
ncbi:unnamed protein product [Arabidopsis halleri]